MMNSSQSRILLILYGFSGLTGLAYEMLWMRLISTLTGVSIFAVVIVLIAFMAGLGLGAVAGVRLRLNVRAALRLFAMIEGAVAIFSMFLPAIAHLLGMGLAGVAADISPMAWMILQAIGSVLLLLLPASALGVAFPMVLRSLPDTGVCRVYGINTLGGVAGALLPLMLLPLLGWSVSIRLIAVLGCLIAILAFYLSVQLDPATKDQTDKPIVRPGWAELGAYAGMGAAALMLEVGWTRLFGMIFLRTEYVLGVILAAVLSGIAIGSLLSHRFSARVLNIAPLLAASAVFLSIACLPAVSSWFERWNTSSMSLSLLVQAAVVFVLTMGATCIMGAWLPMIAKRYDQSGSAAWLYGVNSLGAALGAACAGWLILPLWGAVAAIVLAAGLLAVCGAYWCDGWRPRLILLALIPVMAWLWQPPSVAHLLPAAYGESIDLFRQEDAVSTAHVIEQRDGNRLLLSDLQRLDASTDPTAVAVQKNQARLALLLHPRAKRVLFLGLGTGITASVAKNVPGLTATAVELSSGAIRAAQDWFAVSNGHIKQWLDVRHDDARRFLMANDTSYDVIVGDLFHPDLAGRGMLLSTQQFFRVRARLAPTGVYVQWLALNQFDVESLRVVLATFQKVFPNNALFLDGFHLAMAGFKSTLPSAAAIEPWAAHDRDTLTGGEGWQTWLGRSLGSIPALDVSVQDEWRPIVEYRLARARTEGRLDLRQVLQWLSGLHHEPATLLQRWHVSKANERAVTSAMLATHAMIKAWMATFALQGNGNPFHWMRLAYESNRHDRWAGFALADAMSEHIDGALQRGLSRRQAWLRVLSIRPDHVPALKALLHLAINRKDSVAAARFLKRLKKLAPFDREVRAVTL